MASDLSSLDLLVIQIDGIHMDEDLILVAAVGVDAKGDKHPLGLAEGATENATTLQALIDNLVQRGFDPAVPRLFIIDGAKALSKAIRRTFGRAAAIQRCQVHKVRNIYGAVAQIAARFGAARVATSMGAGRRRQGRKADPQPRPTSRTRLVRGLRLDPGRHRRDSYRHSAWIAEGVAALTRLHQHYRECDGHGAARLPEREALAFGFHGLALDRSRYAGSGQRLPTTEGSQATFQRYVLLWKHARQTTRPAVSLLAKPTPLNINFGSDRFAMFNKQRDTSIAEHGSDTHQQEFAYAQAMRGIPDLKAYLGALTGACVRSFSARAALYARPQSEISYPRLRM